MLLKKLLIFCIGYLKIEVEGFFIERFINICRQKNILLHNNKRSNSACLIANISIKNFKKLKSIAKKTKCRIKIIEKRGLPFVIKKYKKRKIFVVLLFLILLTLVAMSNYIWNIEIKCEEEIETGTLLEILKDNGLEVGKLKKQIDTVKLIQAIRYAREDIAWCGIDFKGTNAILEIVKATPKPEIVNSEEYCNIISDKEGIITKINVQNGTAAVKVGDMVKKGTVLVNGYLEGKYTGIRYVHSNADIEAKVWYSKKRKIPKIQKEKVKTGEEENKFSIKFNNFKINFYKTLSNFKNYDTIEDVKKIKLFSNFYLPIETVKIKNLETVEQTKTYTVNELKQMYIPKIEEELEKVEKMENEEKSSNEKSKKNKKSGKKGNKRKAKKQKGKGGK